MKTLNVSDLLEFISLVKGEDESLQCEKGHSFILFRGQSIDEPLLPKIARDLKWEKIFPTPQRLKFRELEEYMLREFKRRGNPYFNNKPETDLDWLIHAQHHGMATRLLDWTDNPLVALYFAVREFNRKNQPIVWLMKTKDEEIIIPSAKTDPFSQDGTKVFRPNFVSRRLEAQNSWFSVHKYLENDNHFVPLEKNLRFKNKLIKVVISPNSDCISNILEDLDLCGINSATLFPDLDGVSNYINWKKQALRYMKVRMPQSKDHKEAK